MTQYKNLTEEQKKLLEAELEKVSVAVIQAIKENWYCADCWMSYYNRLCSHED